MRLETGRFGDLEIMKVENRKEFEEWVKRWSLRQDVIERIHREEIRRVDTEQSILALEDAFQDAIRSNDIRRDSGCVEMKRWFNRLGITSKDIK
jgi:hypothetical protein